MRRFSHFVEGNPPSAILCLSTFLLADDDEGLLAGRMRQAPEWSVLDHRESIDGLIEPGRWVLPSSHLYVGETPLEAARRIALEQLAASSYDIGECSVFSHYSKAQNAEQTSHWDLCFVYEARIELAGTPSWFDELRRLPVRYLYHDLFVRNHGEVIADMGFLPPAAKG